MKEALRAGRFALRHPIYAATIMAAVFSIAQNQSGTLAQTRDRDPSGLVWQQTGFEVRGKKYFDIDSLKDGVLRLKGFEFEGQHYDLEVDFARQLKDSWLAKLTLSGIRLVIYAQVEGIGKSAYLVFTDGIMRVAPDAKNRTARVSFIYADDSSRIFIGPEQIFIAPNGAIFATTPTSSMIITGKGGKLYVNKDSDSNFPDLQNPKFTPAEGGADMRDPAILGYLVHFSPDGSTSVRVDPTYGAKL